MHSIEEYVPGFFLSHWVFTPGFRIGQRITGVFSVGFSVVSCYANFFTYVTALALKFFDYAYLYNTFPVDRYISIDIFQAIVNNIRTCTLMFMYCQYGFTSCSQCKTMFVNKALVLSVRRHHARVTHQIMLLVLSSAGARGAKGSNECGFSNSQLRSQGLSSNPNPNSFPTQPFYDRTLKNLTHPLYIARLCCC